LPTCGRRPGVCGRLIERQRIDRWLWHARVVRTRSTAAELAAAGHVRINGRRVDAASWPVQVGDVVTVSLYRGVRVMRVTALVERRGSGEGARTLYCDLNRDSTAP
jgi:ribosome-associated heat shock protein Hsp15